MNCCGYGAKVVAVLLVWGSAVLVHAGVYKWTDADGRVHFGDRPPASAEAEPIAVVPPASLGSDDSARNPGQSDRIRSFADRLEQERLVREQNRAEQHRIETKAQESCQRLAARLHHMDSISVFYRLDERGERVFLSDAEGDAYRVRMRQRYNDQCGA
ncbi:MAG: DUF4124 domain-containing protein [Marinobacter sp.]|uniref:DUF4124 domain-containing protein n=1 Tax=Marinobacter sp. TaxID=50741 RepID=UPI00299E597F|nr:DUF4124 domain-containing protein [Marinobacter sp.]MDX1754578.1 DUF4124 domain-containing protein [Marinobacter sp.]